MEQKKYEVDVSAVIFDIMLLADGIFDAELEPRDQTLLMKFANGQTFRLSLQEIAAAD